MHRSQSLVSWVEIKKCGENTEDGLSSQDIVDKRFSVRTAGKISDFSESLNELLESSGRTGGNPHCGIISLHRVKEICLMEWLNALQWPAMVVSFAAAWLVASQKKRKRNWAFWVFLLSNVLWATWGWHDKAYALIFLQVSLATLNIRGVLKNRDG